MTRQPGLPQPADAVQAATKIQREASDPFRSVALRASAGSGKTSVLIDRFLRLCIEGPGRPPHPRSILAVTFTRKAAVEIQERLLSRTAKMALATPEELRAQLADLFRQRPDPEPEPYELERAARLYEQVLEDVSGLNVGTIHSFCQLILNRFAVEAGLDPRFSVIEDAQELEDETCERIEMEIAGDPHLAACAREVGDTPQKVRLALKNIFKQQMRIQRWLDRAAGAAVDPAARRVRTEALPALLAELRERLFPEAPGDEEPSVAALLPDLKAALDEFRGPGLLRIEHELGAEAAAALEKDLAKLRKGAEAISPDSEEAFAAVRKLLVTGNQLRVFTRKQDPALKAQLNEAVAREAMPLLELLRLHGYVDLYLYNRGLLRVGLRALDLYDELKQRDRVVDFQDLEDLARRLMGDGARALSLLYRLDDSITHILLDEFQDTNFNQWEILEPFVEEFLAGGDDERRPTVFFVGDVKQSIYEFRGAEPDLFPKVEQLLAAREQPVLNLPTNFRSLGAVVGGVGCLFTRSPLVDLIEPEERDHVAQRWARTEAPGRHVALPASEDEEPDADGPGRSADQVAADTAAGIVRNLVDSGQPTWEGFGDGLMERPLGWSDVLVLCRSRTEIAVYEKAFQAAGIPVAPSGRGMLAASREVQDVLALLRWLVFPADDAALAVVLRSPLARLSESEFQDVLARRGLDQRDENGRLLPPRGLWQALRSRPDDPVTGPITKRLKTWRKHLGFVSCHDLLRRIYREGEVLERYQAAGGDQARYNLLRLFDLSQGAELASSPTMRRLIEIIDGAARRGGQDEGSLPRGTDQGRVRFMTIHGSKGLEAPVVLLVDADRPGEKEGGQIRLEPNDSNTPLLFGLRKEHRHPFGLHGGMHWPEDPLLAAARIARERGGREEAHLLYVALTRARDRLYVLGGSKEPKSKKDGEFDSPLRRIRSAAADACPDVGLQLDPTETAPSVAKQATGNDSHRPGEHRLWEPPPQRPLLKEINPSGAEEDAGAESESAPAADAPAAAAPAPTLFDRPQEPLPATVRGEAVHGILQLATDQGELPPGSGPLHDEAAAIWRDPELDWIFRPERHAGSGRSEAPVVCAAPRTAESSTEQTPQQITGIIDRLLIRPGRIDIVDYKTNRTGGDHRKRDQLRDHYAPQLQKYREAIAVLYPDHEIRTWLLFTDPELASDARLVECPAKGAGR